jgi:hypothetical protein
MNEDIIMPDDTQETTTPQVESTESTETTEQQTTEQVTDTTETEQKQEQTDTTKDVPKVKLKYNHEEKEYSLDEVIPLAQKGMNYDKLQQKLNELQSNPSLSFVEKQAKKYNLTPEQYIEAIAQQEEQEELNKLIQQNIPEELAKEIMDNKKFRNQYESEKQARAEQEKKQAEYAEFLQSFPDVKVENISADTWDKVNKGIPLRYAYMEQQFNEMQNQVKILKQNETNVKKAPVNGVTQHGSKETAIEDDFLKGFDSI